MAWCGEVTLGFRPPRVLLVRKMLTKDILEWYSQIQVRPILVHFNHSDRLISLRQRKMIQPALPLIISYGHNQYGRGKLPLGGIFQTSQHRDQPLTQTARYPPFRLRFITCITISGAFTNP